MIHVTGRTWDHRDMLSGMDGYFDKTHKRWEFNSLSDRDVSKLRATVGLMVNVVDDPTPEPTSDEWAKILQAIFDGDDDDDEPAHVSRYGRSNVYGDDPTYHNHFAVQNPAAFWGFSSLGKMIETIENIPTEKRRSGWKDDKDFNGTRNMAEAIDLARNGWQDGVEAALELIERLSLDNPRVRRRNPTIAGGRVNVGRMLSGDPRHMISRPKLPGKKRITFFVEAGCVSIIQTETMVIRAALIGAMIDVMENKGYSAAIVATSTSLHHGTTALHQMAVTIKEHGERLNLSDTIFALGHPSFLRRFKFALCSSLDECRPIWSSQGVPTNAFDKRHKCRNNEFYVPRITPAQQRNMTDDPMSLLSSVKPHGLELEFNDE